MTNGGGGAGGLSSKNKMSKNASKKYNSNKSSLVNISAEEQARLVEQTGILKKIPKANAEKPVEEDYFFSAILYSIPFTVLYMTFYFIVHREYQEPWDNMNAASVLIRAVPTIFILIYLSNAYRKEAWMKLILMSASATAGSYLIYIIKKSPAAIIMAQAPGLATLWIYAIFLMDLMNGMGSLLAVGLYYYFGILKK